MQYLCPNLINLGKIEMRFRQHNKGSKTSEERIPNGKRRMSNANNVPDEKREAH